MYLQGIYCGASLLKCHVKEGISNFKTLLLFVFFFLSGTWIISLQKSPKLPRVIAQRSTVLWFVLYFLSFFTPSTDQTGWDSFWGSWESSKWKIIFVLNRKVWSMIWREILFHAASVLRAQHRHREACSARARQHALSRLLPGPCGLAITTRAETPLLTADTSTDGCAFEISCRIVDYGQTRFPRKRSATA